MDKIGVFDTGAAGEIVLNGMEGVSTEAIQTPMKGRSNVTKYT
jgi:hypothetical protein